MATSAGGLDEHIAEQIAELDHALVRVDEIFGNLNAVDYIDVTKNMSSLDKAKYDLTNMYAINSLFWMYLRSFGEDPKNSSIKEELDRVKKQMLRLSQIANKPKMPRIDKDAANRFIRHGLSNPGHKGGPHKQGRAASATSIPPVDDSSENWDEDAMETDAKAKLAEEGRIGVSSKRKREDTDSDSHEEDGSGNDNEG